MTITNDKDDLSSVKKKLESYGQEHLLMFWDNLTESERAHLLNDIHAIDFDKFFSDVEKAKNKSAAYNPKKVDDILEPPAKEVCGSSADSPSKDIERYDDLGLQSIAKGECCVILMAGGAGTRLGVSYPKGMYDVGLPSGKSLYQIQAERLIRLQYLAKQRFNEVTPIMWYIMTSDCTRDATLEYFKSNNYFGLSQKQVRFLVQFTLPVIGLDGKILLESKHSISKSPDGNGGLYRVLRKNKIIDDMKERGIKYVHIYGVDNILITIADPVYFGFFIEKDAECAAMVIEKVKPTESVGVVAKVNGHYQIVEYSEIDKATTELLDPNDSSKLMYRCGNICSHMFNIGFLERICHDDASSVLVQHIAMKNVPFINSQTGNREVPEKINAIKMEQFIFDVFPLANSFVIWEADRDREFSPLKNCPGSANDSPETCKSSVLSYHNLLVRSNLKESDNVAKAADMIFEISALVSYRGEGLAHLDRFVEEAEEGSTLLFELGQDGEITSSRVDNYE